MAEGEGEEEGDEQQADKGGSVWDDDDKVHVITDARHFIPEATSEDESKESEELEDEAPESANMLESPFVEGREEITAEKGSASMYSSVLASPPDRRGGSHPSKTPSSIDPWVSGSDPWRRDISTDFVDIFCRPGSPAASTVSFADQYRVSAFPPTPNFGRCADAIFV